MFILTDAYVFTFDGLRSWNSSVHGLLYDSILQDESVVCAECLLNWIYNSVLHGELCFVLWSASLNVIKGWFIKHYVALRSISHHAQ